MLANETAPLSEVAKAIGRSEGWLMRHWLKIHEQDGFPRKLSLGWVWPRRQVEAFLRTGGAVPFIAEAANENVPSDALIAIGESLADRYGGRA